MAKGINSPIQGVMGADRKLGYPVGPVPQCVSVEGGTDGKIWSLHDPSHIRAYAR